MIRFGLGYKNEVFCNGYLRFIDNLGYEHIIASRHNPYRESEKNVAQNMTKFS